MEEILFLKFRINPNLLESSERLVKVIDSEISPSLGYQMCKPN